MAPSGPQYCTISCKINGLTSPVAPAYPGTGGPGFDTVSCEAAVLSATLSVRRVGAVKHDPVSNPSAPATVPADFAPAATVAAGTRSSAEHEADVQVAWKLPDGSPAPAGIPLSLTGRIVSGGQGPNDPPHNVTAAIRLGRGGTDAKGLVTYPAAFQSGQRTEETVIRADYGNGGGPTAKISQVWNEEGAPFSNDDYVNYDVPSTITYTMTFDDENHFTVPITKHHLSFVTTTISGFEWNESAEDYEPASYSGSDIAANGYGGLVSWGNVTENDGVYGTTRKVFSDYNSTVKTYPVRGKGGRKGTRPVDFLADSISFDVVDNDAYDAN